MDNTTTEKIRERDMAKTANNLGTRGKELKKEVEELFHRLHLEAKINNKLRASDVLQITAHSLQSNGSCTEEELVHMFLQKLMMMNYRARSISVTKTSKDHHEKQQKAKQSSAASVDAFSQLFESPSLSDERKRNADPIHPMDVQMAVFHCADGFLKQLMVTKLSQCQYALPLLVPDPFTQQIEFPLWTFREINQSWKMKNNNETISKKQPVWKAETPMVFFFRFGSVSSSKSQQINNLINERHHTFLHRNCPGSSRTRVLMDGVVEIAWFCPSGTHDDKFTDRVAFCNLHGDAGEHEKQLDIMTKMASINVVVLPTLGKNDERMKKIQNLCNDPKPLICLLPEDDLALTEMGNGKYKIGLKDRGDADVSEDLREAITNCLPSASIFRLEDVSKHSVSKHPDIRVDEEDDDDCRKAKEAAQQMMRLLKGNDLTKIKESFLPHQGELWHQWCKMNKELNRPQGDDPEMEISKKKVEMMKIREEQYKVPISEFINLFMKQMNTRVAIKLMYFLKWLKILLDEYTSADLSDLLHKYDKTWSDASKLSKGNNKNVELRHLIELSKELQAASFGLEHIMREIGQIYESCSSVKKNKKDLQFNFSSLPSLAAEMMISGFPLELMDGDAAHVPLVWISAVLDQLIQKLGNQRVFVLSVLGLQSSGKSTMLNAMFGLQFAVSVGRCTRGAFMQLIRISDEMKTQMKFDYILVVDTEGLRAPELGGRSRIHHDNELATFVIGLGNMTLINIFGENPAEMQDILQIVVQAFMRMNKVRLSPSCVFVHQNVSDVTAAENTMEGRRRLQQTLDKMTKLAAEDEVSNAECFSDVIAFDVQKDVVYFAQLWEGSPPMAPPNPSYCENVHNLKKTILSHVSKSNGMMLRDIKCQIKNLWEALLKERFVFSFKNALEIATYRKLEKEYSKWTWSLRRAMLEIENKLHNKIENEAINVVEETDLQKELDEKSTEVKRSMSEFFEKDTNASILIQWKKPFEAKISHLQENIVRETQRKLNEVLQQRDLKKRIDKQRAQNEKTLLEKAKNLASTLKDKANDDKILQNEFDNFWGTWLKEIIKKTPQVKDIDILRDLRDLLRDINESSSVLEHWTKSTQYDVLELSSYSDYVQFKKQKITDLLANIFTRTEYSKEDDNQIRILLADIAHGAYKKIFSYNIAKMGYNKSYIQELIDFIKAKLLDHEQRQQKYVFKKHFFSDLALSICKRVQKTFTEQHKIFKEANDPVLYFTRKREEYYGIFQKYCQGATSATIIGEIICNKLKEPIQQSVYKKTARDLADEMRSNCESMNGNRSNLEKHILKTLAEKEDFKTYITYIHNPKEHFKRFIRDEVSQYINDNFNISVLPKMKDDLRQKENQIIEAVQRASKRVDENSGDADLWLKIFMQNLSDVLIFSEKDLSGVSHDDVDVKHLTDVIIKQLPSIISDMSEKFSTEPFLLKLEYKDKPDEILNEHFCQCCWVQCPFCKAICTNTAEDHTPQPHSVPFHRPNGLNGWHYRGTQNLCADFCTTLVTSTKWFYPTHESKESIPYKDYKSAGGVYADWSITPDLTELSYWKWFVCRFQEELEEYYKRKFQDRGEIPDEWRNHSKQDAIESLDKYFSISS